MGGMVTGDHGVLLAGQQGPENVAVNPWYLCILPRGMVQTRSVLLQCDEQGEHCLHGAQEGAE